MEKLSKLLNEYLESKEKDIQQFMNIAALMTQSDSKLYQTYIISKDFGFIKRLVENEKIDCGTRNPLFITELVGEQEKQMPYSFYEEMLIRLALSDTPIKDLISYLK